MDAEQKNKILSSGSYVMAVANGGLGVYVVKYGYAFASSPARPDTAHTPDYAFFVVLPILMLVLGAIVPIVLRKKRKLGLAFILAAVGSAFFAFCLYAPYTVGVMGL